MLSLLTALIVSQVQIQVSLPTITFQAPPPVVVVEPGIQVVEDQDDEVFFVNNVYWCRRGPHWYRANDHRGGWVLVDGPGVPPALVKVPAGKYRRYKHGKTVVIDTPGPGKVKVKKGKWK
jgi:hypothetical protein